MSYSSKISLSGNLSKTAIVMLVIMLCLPMEAMARTITTFETDNKETVPVDMDNAVTNASATFIDWNISAEPLTARLNITPGPHTTGGKDYPLAPQVNVGGIGGPEWAYVGTGYGKYGLQDTFSDNASYQAKDLKGAGAINTSVLIPKGASIKSGSITINGEAGSGRYSEDFTSSIVGNKVVYSNAYNTLFISTSTSGVLARDLQDGSIRFFNTRTEPNIGTDAPGALFFDDTSGLLFISTSIGLKIINFTTMQLLETINAFSDLNIISNSVVAVDYDSPTGLLIIGQGFYLSVINYTSRKVLGHIATSSWWGDTITSIEYDRTHNRAWAGHNSGLIEMDLTTMTVQKTYNTGSSPSLGAQWVKEMKYDAGNDRLFVGTTGVWNDPRLDIINVGAGTTYMIMSPTTMPALPAAGVTALEYDHLRSILYIGTSNAMVALNVSTKVVAKTYTLISTPPLKEGFAKDMDIQPESGHVAVLGDRWAQVLNVVAGTSIVDQMVQGRTVPLRAESIGTHITDTKKDRVFLRYTNQVSILNLSSNLVETNISGDTILGSRPCVQIFSMQYDDTTNQLFLSCHQGANIKVGVFNMSSMTNRLYYDTTTTPALFPPAGGAGDIYQMAYDPGEDLLALSQYYAGIVLINLTNNATTYITDVSVPMKLPSLSNYDVAMDTVNNKLFVGMYFYGISIFNLSDGSRTEINTTSTPSVQGNLPYGLTYDSTMQRLYTALWNVGIDVFNISSMTLVKRYNLTSTPATPVMPVYRLSLDPVNMLVSAGGANGSMVLNTTTGQLQRWYNLASSPSTLTTAVTSADRQTVRDWDVLNEGTYFQLMKPSPLPMDLELRVNNEFAWEHLGSYSGSGAVTGIGPIIQRALNSGRCKELPPDAFGNVLVEVPMRITTQRAGLVNLSNLAVEYNITATTNDFSSDIMEYLNGTNSSWDRHIPITVTMASPGKLTLDGLGVTIDEAPFFDPLPTELWVLENSMNTKVLDLWTYVHDDLDMDTDLTYTVTPLANGTHFSTGILEDRWLLIDTLSPPGAKNWTGELLVSFSAIDTRGLRRVSDPMTVRVEPMQEIYILSSPPTSAIEDTVYIYEMRAESHRGLPLNFSLDEGPRGMAINATSGILTWTPGNADVGAHAISIHVTDGTHSAVQEYVLTVGPVNDAPTVKMSHYEMTAYEGTPLVMDLTSEITDIDDGPENLTLLVASSFATIDGLALTFLYPRFSRISGENVSVTVSDGKASATLTIAIKVIGTFWVEPLSDISLFEGTARSVDIAPNIHDPALKALKVTASSSFVTVNGTMLTFLYPVGSGMTEENVTIKVSDGTVINDSSMGMKVSITPVFPIVTIVAPTPGWVAPGKFKATGTAAIAAGAITKVEIKLDEGEWKTASGTDVWEMDIDITGLSSGVHYIYVRANAGNATSDIATSRFVIEAPETKEVRSSDALMLGLAIGLILAMVLAIIMYMVGKKGAAGRPDIDKKRGGAGAMGARGGYEENDDASHGGEDRGEEGHDEGPAYSEEERYHDGDQGDTGDHEDYGNGTGEDDGYGGEAFENGPATRRR